ncbi:MAG: hypothetical protein EOO24_49485, partial [Comamonadaceae bacterium]
MIQPSHRLVLIAAALCVSAGAQAQLKPPAQQRATPAAAAASAPASSPRVANDEMEAAGKVVAQAW